MIQIVKKPITVTSAKDPSKNGVYYYASFSRKGTADTVALAEQMNEGSSSFTKGEVVGVTLDLPVRIQQALVSGQAVKINGLGTFKPSLSTKEVKMNPDELKASAVSIKGINFKPDASLLSTLNQRATYEWISIDKANEEDANDDDAEQNGTEGGSNADTPGAGTGTDTEGTATDGDNADEGGSF